jgi:hypothetical protein
MSLSPPVAIHCLFRFPAGFLGAFILAAVPTLFALRQSDFDLGNAVAEVDPQRNDGQTFRIGTSRKFINLAFVKQEFAVAEGFVVPGTAGHVLSDVGVNEVSAAGLKVHIGVADIRFPLAQSFYLGAMQHQACFQLLKDMVIVGSRAILGDDLFLGPFPILGPLGFVVWLNHNLSFYLMTRLIQRAGKVPATADDKVQSDQGN